MERRPPDRPQLLLAAPSRLPAATAGPGGDVASHVRAARLDRAYGVPAALQHGGGGLAVDASADPARWAADPAHPYCPFCRSALAALPRADDGCANCGAPLSPPPAGLPRSAGAGRRGEVRIDRHDRALMQLPGEAGEFVVRLQDLSFGGIALESPRALPPGSALRVLAFGFDAVAQVLRCRRGADGFTLHGRLLTLRLLRRAGSLVSRKA